MSFGPRPSSKDLIAGVGVALILIPQSMAYAELAGLPARHGLFAAALGPLAAAFFASSPQQHPHPRTVRQRALSSCFRGTHPHPAIQQCFARPELRV